MRYYIDGYNLIFWHSDLATLAYQTKKGKGLERAREAAIELLSKFLGLRKLSLTLVFDSPQKVQSSHYDRYLPFNVIYASSHESADAWMLEQLQAHTKKRPATIVTNDLRLARNVIGYGANTLTFDQFFEKMAKRAVLKGKSEKYLSPQYIKEMEQLFEERYIRLMQKEIDLF